MSQCGYSTAISALAELMAEHFTDAELALISAVLVQLGDSIATVLALRARCTPTEK